MRLGEDDRVRSMKSIFILVDRLASHAGRENVEGLVR